MKGTLALLLAVIVAVFAGLFVLAAVLTFQEALSLGLESEELEGEVVYKWRGDVEFHLVVAVPVQEFDESTLTWNTRTELISTRVDDVAWFSHEVGDPFAWTPDEVGPGQGFVVMSLALGAVAIFLTYIWWTFFGFWIRRRHASEVRE